MAFVLRDSRWSLDFRVVAFSELHLQELYDCMVLRQEVFVVEQDCPYLDVDGKDQDSWHVLGYDKQQLVAYTRIVPLGVSYPNHVSIGRVVTHAKVRRTGIGKELMTASLAACHRLFPGQDIKISAQTYLLKFYQGFGFQPIGEGYLEDGIPHQGMVRPASQES